MEKEYKILLADDHSVIRDAYKSYLSKIENYHLVAEAGDGNELVEKYFIYHPDIIIVDISMPNKNGIEALKEIKTKDENVKALFISVNNEKEDIFSVYKAGGKGLLNKNITEDIFILAVKEILGDKLFFGFNDDKELEKVIKEFDEILHTASYDNVNEVKLQDRERRVLKLIGKGFTTKQIAEEIGVSLKTIELYRSRIRNKFDLSKNITLQTFAFKYFCDEI